MGWINAIVAIVTIILFFMYRSYKSDSESLQKQLNDSQDEVKKLENELNNINSHLTYSTDIVSQIMDSNKQLLASFSQLENESESTVNYSVPLSLYYNEQNTLLQELIENKPPSNQINQKTQAISIPRSPLMSIEERRRITQIEFSEKQYRTQMKVTENRYQGEINALTERYKHLDKLQSNLTAIPYMAGIIADYETYGIEVLAQKLDWGYSYERSKKVDSIREIRSKAKEIAEKNLKSKYQLQYLLELFPILKSVLITDFNKLNIEQFESEISEIEVIKKTLESQEKTHNERIIEIEKLHESKIKNLKEKIEELQKENTRLNILSYERDQKYMAEKEKNKSLSHIFESNQTAIPYMAAFISDYETYELEALAKRLDWGHNVERSKKVASIREIRRAAKEMAERNLEAKYQLQYILELFPNLQDVIETDYKQLPLVKIEDLSDYDAARDWLSKEEYQSLSTVERNQLALDRYKESHNKTKWQIGRDYELFVGYTYQQKGYTVDYFGSYMGLEDLGRDLIAKKDSKTLIIQCKYWGHEKVIHEKHVTQLYGTMASYIIEQGLPSKNVTGILVTNISLSDQAKKMADFLKIKYVENLEKGDYPCIKCNIGSDEYGKTYIYHLPFDQQYDSTKIDAPGEFFAMTVKEAEEKGFRRAFKWFGS